MSLERFLRSLHGWMGAIILPWVVMVGLTGLYMNHSKLVLSLLPSGEFDLAAMDASPLAAAQTVDSARALAARARPGVVLIKKNVSRYLGRPVVLFSAEDQEVMVDQATGHYWLISRYQRKLFAPDGAFLQRQIRWGRVLSSWHQTGWLGGALGTWPADIVACALMLFGASGIYVFTAPRLRRRKNRRARMRLG